MKATTNKDFIEKSKAIHGDKFDYSKVKYKNLTTKVIIGCKDCGEWFEQTPDSHLKGNGHRGCTKSSLKKESEKNFFEKAKKIHGDKYDYSETKFLSTDKKIKIFCKKHKRPFEIIANNFLNGFGCPECEAEESKQKRINKFVEKAKEIKPEYDYSEIVYNGIYNPATIKCYKHGEFSIIPQSWIKTKQACPECQKEKNEEIRIIEEKNFIKEARTKFGDKFDFSNTKFKNRSSTISFKCNDCGNSITLKPSEFLARKIGCSLCAKVSLARSLTEFLTIVEEKRGDKITLLNPEEEYKNEESLISAKCEICGNEYKQTARNLMFSKYSCKICASKEISKNKEIFKPLTKEEFIEKSVKVHGNRYDYSKVEYINKDTPVLIYCPEHDYWFTQKPRIHYSGSRCPICAKKMSKAEELIARILNSKNIDFRLHKSFSDLKDKISLSYDFFIKEYNILIEFQGRQHYKNIYSKPLHEWHRQLHHDWLKRKYAAKHGYNLISIPYWNFSNIEQILDLNLKKAA